MSHPVTSIIPIVLTIFICVLFARRIKKVWAKIWIFISGALVVGSILVYPYLITADTPSDAEIFSLLYGPKIEIRENPNGNTIYISEQLSEVEKEQFSYAAQVNTQIVHKRNGWEGDRQQWMVLTKTGPPDCCNRSFLPVLGCAILAWNDGTWQVVSYQKLITPLFAFDRIAEGEFVEIGQHKFGFLFQDRTTQNNGTQTWDLVIAEIDGRLKPVVKIETLANNETQCPPLSQANPCWEYTAEYEFITGTQPEYDDILVTTSGTKLVDETIVPFAEITKFIFEHGKYLPQP